MVLSLGWKYWFGPPLILPSNSYFPTPTSCLTRLDITCFYISHLPPVLHAKDCLSFNKYYQGQPGLVTHAYNSSCLGGKDWEGQSSRPAQVKSY
jgi:hypothetical protein